MEGELEKAQKKHRHKLFDSDEERLFMRLKLDYSCGICLSILTDAVTTPCGHLFCGNCLRTWEQSIFPEVSCPKCRKPFKMEDTIRMYNGTSAKNSRRIHLTRRQKKYLEQDTPFGCSRLSNILLYDSDFSDSLSLKSTLLLIGTLILVMFVLMWILKL